MSKELEQFAEKYFSGDMSKSVPLHLLRAWLSEHHYHDEDGKPMVPSMDLDRWATDTAVTRVVDHTTGDDGDVWTFFEHGWHKDGCKARLAQEGARIGTAQVDRVWMIQGTLDEATSEKIGEKMVGGYSVDDSADEEEEESPAPYWRQSDTTGRWHSCAIPPEVNCYWSGDPYSPHEMGF